MTNFESDNSKEKLRSLILGSAEIAGHAATATLGFFAPNPFGAAPLGAGGSVASMILKNL